MEKKLHSNLIFNCLNAQNIRQNQFGSNFLSACRVLSLLLAIIATTFILPVTVGFVHNEYDMFLPFFIPFAVVWVIASFFLITCKNKHFHMSIRGVFAVVACCWIFGSILGAIPFMLSGCIPNFADAFFESASGFTTTGASILSAVENLPISINLWRCQMHWLGGMGIVALTVALLPILGVGGFQLIKAETTGPEKGKVTPKITMTAKTLWFIYLGMTVIQTVLLMIAGMPFFEAISHTFATLGTGGFSTRNLSVGAYNSATIDWICTVFMILAGVNFSLYYYLLIGKGKEVFKNTELKVYIGIFAISTILVTVFILPEYHTFGKSLRYAAFQVSSILTTTGFSTADFEQWAPAAKMILCFLMLIGGCSGSTGGSIKVIRWVVLAKQMKNEVRLMLHPHGVFGIRLNGRAGRKDIVYNVAPFFFLYTILVAITSFASAVDGADLLTSITAGISIVGNVGPGLGLIGPTENYGFFSDWVKILFSFAMIAGRLELYTILIFFMPDYWKK